MYPHILRQFIFISFPRGEDLSTYDDNIFQRIKVNIFFDVCTYLDDRISSFKINLKFNFKNVDVKL